MKMKICRLLAGLLSLTVILTTVITIPPTDDEIPGGTENSPQCEEDLDRGLED